jgi:hypothetical protein
MESDRSTGPSALAVPESSDVQGPMSTVFGYSVRSTLAFTALRSGIGTPLEVTVGDREQPPDRKPLMEWVGGETPDVRLFDLDGTYAVSIDGIGTFRVDPEAPSIAVSGPAEGPRREARLLGLPMALCFARRGDLPLHAAAVEVDGSALLLAGPGRHGKSTLAGAFLNAGYRTLSEDTTCYRPGPVPAVVPGSALLRIRPDVFERLEFPHAREVARDPDRVYLAADGSMRGDTSPVPVCGVVFLRIDEAGMRLERLPREKVLPDLWTLSFLFPTDQDRARCFAAIADLARTVPVWNLYRRLSFDSLPTLVEQLAEKCGRP